MLEALKARARQLKRESLTLYIAVRDPRTPWTVRLLAGAIVAYALSPIDLIPDFIPVLGYLDEVILLPIAIALALRLLPEAVLADARAQAEHWQGKPRSRLGAAIIILIWSLALILLGRWCWALYRAA